MEAAPHLVPPTHYSCPQLRFVGKLNFAISRMLTLVLVLRNKAFYG